MTRTQAETIAGYRRVDFADFGDKEKDPLMRKALGLPAGSTYARTRQSMVTVTLK